MDWRDIALALGGFLGGLLASLLKAVFPSYVELSNESRALRKECEEMREKIWGLEDTIRDAQESEEDEHGE